jgi:uncharacterized protein involved in exopolysaccharide biosynthesis
MSSQPSHDATENLGVENKISFLDLLQVVVENLRLLVFGSLGIGIFTLFVSFFITPTFTAKTQFLPPQQQQSSASALIQSLGAMGGLTGAAGIKNPSDQYIAFLKTNSIQDGMIERFELLTRYDKKFKQDARKELLTNTKFTGGKDGIISIEVDDDNSQMAADMANGYIDELKKLITRLAFTEAQMRRQFFENKLRETKFDLAKAEVALKSTGISSSVLKSSPISAVEVVARVRAGIAAQEIKIASMRGYLAETSPDFHQALKELSAFKDQLRQAEKNQPVVSKEIDYIERYRDFKYHETLFELFAKQYELARLDESREGTVIQVIDVAVAPEKKTKPKKALIAVLATIAAGFFLLMFVFVRNRYRNAIVDNESKEKIALLQSTFSKLISQK